MPDINMQVFEEVKRNQLVTEVDIQTQVALDDYQVQLSDVDNPTQSQDNVVIDRFGEFISHWNESLDFDTWIKISMELAGKKLLMIHGNVGLNSESSIDDTFLFGDDFSSDLSKWSAQSVSTSITDEILHAYPTANYGGLRSLNSINISDSRMMEARIKMNNVANQQNGVGFFDRTDATTWYQHPSIFNRHVQSANSIYGIIDTEGTHSGTILHSGTDINWHRYKIKVDEGTHPLYWYDSDTITKTINVVADTYYIWVPKAYDTYSSNEWTECDWIFVRKYTATEPTSSIGTLKNISTALKSLGRTG